MMQVVLLQKKDIQAVFQDLLIEVYYHQDIVEE
jgi:hypothetical protein